MEDKVPIDGEYGLDYQIFIMRSMINVLPKDAAQHLHDQLDMIKEAIKNRFDIVKKLVETNLEDASVAIKALEFDLYATKLERDDLRDKLNES